MTLTDAGPLIALIDRGDEAHAACVGALSSLTRPLLTTWPCLTEAMYLLGRSVGYPGQEALWGYVTDGLVTLHDISAAEADRMRELMAQYWDTPMDLADASLVTAAETFSLRRVFTTDSHFYAYRALGKQAFEVVP
jgi:predicted nucleic acid-binding protein